MKFERVGSAFARRSRRSMASVIVGFVALFAVSVGLSVRATGQARGQSRVIQVATRQRTLAERYVQEVLLSRAGYHADPDQTVRDLTSSAIALTDGGLVPAVNGDDDEIQLRAVSDPTAHRQLLRARVLIGDLTAQGTAMIRGRTGQPRLRGGEQLTPADPTERLRVLAKLVSNVSLNAALSIGTASDREVGHTIILEVVLAGCGLLAALLLARTLIRVIRRQSRDAFRRLFADNPQPMLIYAMDTGFVLDANGAAVAHYGYTSTEFQARRFVDLDAGEPGAPNPSRVGTTQPAELVEVRHRLADGRIIDVEMHTNHMLHGGTDAVLVAINDVTVRNDLETELRHKAFHDSLTNLANRALFADRVEHAITRLQRDRRSTAVLLLDLDDFKTVNDSMGHGVGDELLTGVATRLAATLRAGTTVARLGGDEFAILLEDLDHPGEACVAAERILDGLATPFIIDARPITIRASIGIAAAGPDGATFDELLRNADAAMYTAKTSGNSYRVFESQMHTDAVDRLQLETDLRSALDHHQLVLHYQPVVDASDATITSVEALVRWNHPTRGLLPPAEFIALAETTGLIVDLGRFVLRSACAQTQTWRTSGNPDLGIAVNVSARQLTDPNFVATVVATLAETGLTPCALTLEITESTIITNPTTVSLRLAALKELGVRLAIDDFGTGYSSLAQLQNLPVDVLKIDKAFIDAFATGPDADAIVTTIVNLAATLYLDTIAEGVEHQDQANRLEHLGCQKLQGYLFSRPVPADAMTLALTHDTTATQPSH